jgi:hypothetical protein
MNHTYLLCTREICFFHWVDSSGQLQRAWLGTQHPEQITAHEYR